MKKKRIVIYMDPEQLEILETARQIVKQSGFSSTNIDTVMLGLQMFIERQRRLLEEQYGLKRDKDKEDGNYTYVRNYKPFRKSSHSEEQ